MVGECEGEGRNGGESLILPLTNKIKVREEFEKRVAVGTVPQENRRGSSGFNEDLR